MIKFSLLTNEISGSTKVTIHCVPKCGFKFKIDNQSNGHHCLTADNKPNSPLLDDN